MKDVPQDILDVFFEVKELVKGQIVNADTAAPIDLEKDNPQTIDEAKKIVCKRGSWSSHPKMYIAEFWLAFVLFAIEECYIYRQANDFTDLLRPLPHFFMLCILVIFYKITIGQLPLQTTVNKLILNKREYHKKHLHDQYYNARAAADRKGPCNGWGLIFNSKELEEMYKIKQIPVLIHESIVLALSALKYKSFDCMGISALILLKLIEKNNNYTLKWYYKLGSDFDGHNFIVAEQNNNGFVPDAWYDVCTDVLQIHAKNEFLLKYPLLSLEDKTLAVTIKPQDYVYYEGYIRMLNKELTPMNKINLSV